MKLQLADSLSLPSDAAAQKIAFIGRTGSGKTYGAGRMVEQMLDAAMQVVILDPVGVWYGLRLLADGLPGYPVPVFGGLKGDIPLEPTGGALIADLVVDRTISVVIDVSQFESDADKARFAKDFADRFFFRKKSAPSAVHLVIEECQEFIPQNPQKGEERMLHAFVRICKLGRNFGIGASLLSQRPQEVSKKALNQTELLFAFQMTGPQERKAIELWMSEKGIDSDIAGDLPSLKVGQCYAWSPQWLSVNQKIVFLPKKTANSSSTPGAGVKTEKRELAPIDLANLAERMKETIERAKADDPKLLKQEIAKLRREISVNPPVSAKEDSGKSAEFKARLRSAEALLKSTMKIIAKINAANFAGLTITPEEISSALTAAVKQIGRQAEEKIAGTLRALERIQTDSKAVQLEVEKLMAGEIDVSVTVAHNEPFTIKPRSVAHAVNGTPSDLDNACRKILDTVAMLKIRGLIPNREMLARWHRVSNRNGLHPTGGTYGQNLAKLRAAGYLDGCELTASGEALVNPIESGFDAACATVDASQERILRVLADHPGNRFSRETMAQALDLHPTGGTYGQNLARLRAMGLIPERGEIYLTEAAER